VRCGQFSRLPENQRLVLLGVNLALLSLFILAVGRQWSVWQRVSLYVFASLIAQEAITQIFMRFEPVKRDMKHEDVV
jgi:hypothetical protein